MKDLLRYVKSKPKIKKFQDSCYLSEGKNAAMDEEVLRELVQAFNDLPGLLNELRHNFKSIRKISAQLWGLIDGWEPSYTIELFYARMGLESRIEYCFTQKHLEDVPKIKEKLLS